MINTLKRIQNIETKELNARIKQRVEQLQLCTERLELRKDNLFKRRVAERTCARSSRRSRATPRSATTSSPSPPTCARWPSSST